MDDLSREDWIAGVRAEIERDGIHVAITDDELWEAMVSPLREARRRHDQALADLGPKAERAARALDAFAAALRDGESIDKARRDIDDLPITSEDDDR